MEGLTLGFTVVFPLAVLMVLGYGLRRLKVIDSHAAGVMNRLVFTVFLPVLLFYNIYETELAEAFDGRLLAFAVIGVVILFGVLVAVVPLFEKDGRRRGVLVQGIMRSNFVLFGLPVTMSLLGEGGAGVTSIAIAVVVPLFNVLSVVALELYRGGRISWRRTLRGIVTNPLILASVAGVLVLVSGLRLPGFVETTLRDISRVATPLALIVLGASFEVRAVRANTAALVWGVLCRLLVVPGVFVTAAVLLGFRGASLVTVLTMFASPTAVSSFTMAQQMGADGELAGQLVVFTTLFSILSMFLFVSVFHQLGLL